MDGLVLPLLVGYFIGLLVPRRSPGYWSRGGQPYRYPVLPEKPAAVPQIKAPPPPPH